MVFPELCHSCYACSELCPTSSLPMISGKIGELKHYKNAFMAFVEGRLDIGKERAVPLISQTIDYVTNNFQKNIFKIFDSPPGTSCPVIEVMKNADYVILVTEPTPFGLNDLKLAVETVRMLNRKFAVVINRFGIGNNDVMDYCKSENIEVIAKIPNDRRIAELYSRGDFIYHSISEVEEQLENIRKFFWNSNRRFDR